MANENENQGGFEGKQSEFDKQKKDQTGQQGQQSEFGQQGQAETKVADPAGQQGETAQPGAGQKGASSGFVGSQGKDTGEYLQEDKTKQAGFAEQGRGAPEEGSDIEGGGERTANRSTDVEGSSGNR